MLILRDYIDLLCIVLFFHLFLPYEQVDSRKETLLITITHSLVPSFGVIAVTLQKVLENPKSNMPIDECSIVMRRGIGKRIVQSILVFRLKGMTENVCLLNNFILVNCFPHLPKDIIALLVCKVT